MIMKPKFFFIPLHQFDQIDPMTNKIENKSMQSHSGQKKHICFYGHRDKKTLAKVTQT